MAEPKHILDRLDDAEQKGKGLVLSPTDVGDLQAEIGELELARELDAIVYEHVIAELQGIKRTTH
jgi:hypothetical protein